MLPVRFRAVTVKKTPHHPPHWGYAAPCSSDKAGSEVWTSPHFFCRPAGTKPSFHLRLDLIESDNRSWYRASNIGDDMPQNGGMFSP
jgi:hypothetical protein